MTETTTQGLDAIKARRCATDEAHFNANRRALLEHARMGRSVPVAGKTEKVVWLSPAEIFALYGLDEFGRPQPAAAE